MRHVKLGFFLSHPIQYYSPWFRRLAGLVDLHVYYFVKQNPKGQAQSGFGVEFDWDMPLLDGYSYTFLKNRARNPSVGRFWGANTPEVEEICRAQRFDAVVLVGWNRWSAWQTIHACRRAGTPVLMRGDSILEPGRTPYRMVKYIPYRAVLPHMGTHLYVGQRNLEYLRHYGVPEQRLHFVPHFVDDEWFGECASVARRSGTAAGVRAALGIPENAVVALFCGKLLARKRPQDLVRACLTSRGEMRGAEFHVVLVGDGPMHDHLEEEAGGLRGSRVHLAGFQNQTALPSYYAAADFLVLPSERHESWGLVANEAMACGLPVIVTDRVGCAPDLVTARETGMVYPVGDVPALITAMQQMATLLNTQRERIQESVAARSACYSITAATSSLLKALEIVSTRH